MKLYYEKVIEIGMVHWGVDSSYNIRTIMYLGRGVNIHSIHKGEVFFFFPLMRTFEKAFD